MVTIDGVEFVKVDVDGKTEIRPVAKSIKKSVLRDKLHSLQETRKDLSHTIGVMVSNRQIAEASVSSLKEQIVALRADKDALELQIDELKTFLGSV